MEPELVGQSAFNFFFLLRAHVNWFLAPDAMRASDAQGIPLRTRWYFAHDQYLAALIGRGSSFLADGPALRGDLSWVIGCLPACCVPACLPAAAAEAVEQQPLLLLQRCSDADEIRFPVRVFRCLARVSHRTAAS